MEDRYDELFKGDGTPTGEKDEIQLTVRGDTTSSPDKGDVDSLLDNFEQIKQITETIHENSEHIKDLKVKSNNESAGEVQKAIFDDLDTTMKTTAELAKKAKSIIKQCEDQNDAYERDNTGAPSLWFRKNMLATGKRLMKMSFDDFRAASEEFEKGLARKITRQAKFANPELSEKAIEKFIESKDPHSFMEEALIPKEDTEELLDKVVKIEEKHESILRIERGVKEIQELFNDLAFFVDLQGEKLEDIEHNVRQTSAYTSRAASQIKKAEVSAEDARKKRRYITLCCILILVVIIIPVSVYTSLL